MFGLSLPQGDFKCNDCKTVWMEDNAEQCPECKSENIEEEHKKPPTAK